VLRARRDGVLALEATLEYALLLWPWGKYPVEVIVADLCCGLNASAIELIRALTAITHEDVLRHPVVLVNLMRGRDAQSNATRRTMRAMVSRAAQRGLSTVGHSDDAKHRGKQFILEVLAAWMNPIKRAWPSDIPAPNFAMIGGTINGWMGAVHHTYTNHDKHLVFDSTCFRWPFQTKFLKDKDRFEVAQQMCQYMKPLSKHKADAIRRRIAAWTAITTSRGAPCATDGKGYTYPLPICEQL
jgi:hypothetical protein